MSERPVDLRLLPAAAAAWVAAAASVRPGAERWVTGALVAVLAVGLVVAGALALVPAAIPARTVAPATGRGRRRRARRWREAIATVLVAAAACAAVLASGAAHLAARGQGQLLEAAAQHAVVVAEGVVVSEATPAPTTWDRERVTVVLRLDRLTVRGRAGPAAAEVLVEADRTWFGLATGTRVRVPGRLAPLEGRRPAVLDAGAVAVLAPPGPLLAAVARLRGGLRAATESVSGDARALVPGAAIGDVSRLDTDLEEAMRIAGLTHLVAVSGQHVAIVLLAAVAVAAAARAPRWGRGVVAVLAVLGFVLLVGPGASVLRAAAMGGVAVLGLALGRPAWPLPALFLAVIGLLLLDPWATGSLGFQLSVVATAAIVLLAGPAARALHERWPGTRWRPSVRALGVLTVPLAAQSAVGPVMVLVDPVVSMWAVPANVVAAPAVVPVTLLGLAATMLGAVWPEVAIVVAHLAAVPAVWIGAVARGVAVLPGAATAWRPGAAGAIALAALCAAAWLAARALLTDAPTRAAPRHRQAGDGHPA